MSDAHVVHIDSLRDPCGPWVAMCGADIIAQHVGNNRPSCIDTISGHTETPSKPTDAWNINNGEALMDCDTANFVWCHKCVALVPLLELSKVDYG